MDGGGSVPRPWKIVRQSDDGGKVYDGYFQLELADDKAEADDDSKAFVRLLNSQLLGLAPDGDDAAKADHNIAQIAAAQAEFIKSIASVAEAYIAGEPLISCAQHLGESRGIFVNERRMITDASRWSVNVQKETDGYVSDVSISPGSGASPTTQQTQLAIEVRRTVTVVLVVFQQRMKRDRLAWMTGSGGKFRSRSNFESRSRYLTKLAEIARLGLNSPDGAPFALMQLDAFKDEFVAREADSVKSRHVRSLGARALIIAVIMAFVYVYADVFVSYLPVPDLISSARVRQFALLIIGASGGTWLSFSLRRVIIGFNDLSLLEEDRLAPLSRLCFVGLLTVVFAMLLITQLVVIDVGKIAVEVGASPIMTLLIGSICGIAERALASAVAHKAGDIIGKAEPTPAVPAASQAAVAGK